MANTFKFGNGNWATKEDSVLAYNDENNNFKPLPFDFTRASTATYVDSDGLIKTASNNEARIDYLDNADGHLLLEPARTNKLTTSEDFSSYAKIQTVTLTANYGTSPSGDNDSTRVVFTASNSALYKYSLHSGNTEANTIYIKGTSGETIKFGKSTGVNAGIIFTLNGNWQRLEFSSTVGNQFSLSTYSGVTARDVEIWGAQIEQGSYATSYIPTSGSTVTRVADACDNGANEQVFNNDTAVWFIDLERIGIDNSEIGDSLTLRDDSNVRQITLWFDAPAQQIRFRDGKNSFAQIGGAISTSLGTRKKIALKIDGETLKVFAEGSQVGANYTKVNSFDITQMDMQGIGYKIREIKFYNTALTDQELIALTTI